jgi:glycosyltransferase involved in cell wall biosynthesis
MKNLSIIIPVFNEQEGLTKTIREMDDLLENPEFEIEIIFVNDASTDKSSEILQGLAGRSYKVLHHETNRGYGAALKTGIKSASSEYICIADADGTYPYSEIPHLAQAMSSGYSMVVGARTGDTVKIPLLRRLPKWILNKLVNYLTGVTVPDINSGLRVMRKEDVERFLNILPDGFSFTTTITLAMHTSGYQIKYIPISYYKRTGKSKINPISQPLNFIQLIIRTVMYFNPLRVFLPISLILFLISLASLIYRTFHAGGLGVFTMIMFMAAIQFLTAGMIADLIIKRGK